MQSNPERSFIVRHVKQALHRRGRMIVNRDMYGLDEFVDLKLQSQAWRYPTDIDLPRLFVVPEREMFVCSNALYALPPSRQRMIEMK
jgi:hypothetical protein